VFIDHGIIICILLKKTDILIKNLKNNGYLKNNSLTLIIFKHRIEEKFMKKNSKFFLFGNLKIPKILILNIIISPL